MTKPLTLNVQTHEQKVGTVEYTPEEDIYDFVYDQAWVKNQHFTLSPHITYENHKPGAVKRFLENLLPEGRGLTDLSKLMKVSKSNVFALVNSIGRDLAGALEITTGGMPTETSFRNIPMSELQERVKKRAQQPIGQWDGKPRLSIAGVQDKLPITIRNNTYGLGEGNLASTHILKFGPRQDQHIVLNEYFCMQLANLVKIPVASTELVDLNERVLQVKRFDRQQQNDDFVSRKHTIDGCQALDVAPDHKYERFLGDEPSVRDILGPAKLRNLYNFCGHCRQPAKTKLEILRWVIFNLLLGNSDNHIKNVSYFVDDSGIMLAPFYDIACITVYDSYSHSMAFCIGEEFEPLKVNSHHLKLMADELELKHSFIKRHGLALATGLSRALRGFSWDPIRLTPNEEEFIKNLTQHIEDKIQYFQSQFDEL